MKMVQLPLVRGRAAAAAFGPCASEASVVPRGERFGHLPEAIPSMRTSSFLPALTAILASCSLATPLPAQIAITSFAAAVTENFDSIGTSAPVDFLPPVNRVAGTDGMFVVAGGGGKGAGHAPRRPAQMSPLQSVLSG
jgi:hypothetical protein